MLFSMVYDDERTPIVSPSMILGNKESSISAGYRRLDILCQLDKKEQNQNKTSFKFQFNFGLDSGQDSSSISGSIPPDG